MNENSNGHRSQISATLTVTEATSSDWKDWDAYVARAPSATFCHTAAWKRVVDATWRHRPCYLIARRGPCVTGVLPLFHVKSVFGSMLVSVPNGVYGGIVADDRESGTALLERAKALATEWRVRFLELRNSFPDQTTEGDASIATKDLYVTFDHPICPTEEAMLNSLPRDVRRMIRVGAKNGLAPETGHANLLDEFYDVYTHSMRSLGTPVFPKRLFARFLEEFSDSSDILAIRHDGRLVSAVLSFYFKNTVAPYYAGAYRKSFHLGTNYSMYWELMRHAAARGCTRFDFGRSKKGTGAYSFKCNWKMREHELPYEYFLVRERRLPDLSPNNRSFRPAIAVWQRLPLPVTRLLGPVVVRHLP